MTRSEATRIRPLATDSAGSGSGAYGRGGVGKEAVRLVLPELGFGFSSATAYRYLDEALEKAAADGVPYLILDGKVIECDQLTEPTISKKGHESDAWYSGKSHGFGGAPVAALSRCRVRSSTVRLQHRVIKGREPCPLRAPRRCR
jgi:hypothetical protein